MSAAASSVRYEERVGAPTFLWVGITLFAVSLGIAYEAAVGLGWALLVFGAAQGLGTWWLLATRARVAVEDGALVAGRARLPVHFVSEVEVLDAERTRWVAGPGADARAYLLLRGSARTAVRVVLDDPADPTPYWLVSTRWPDRLREAVLAAQAAANGSTP